MLEHSALRPIERRVLRLSEEGLDHSEIARRFRRSSDFIARLIDLAQLPGRVPSHDDQVLRPLERRILGWRQQGIDYSEIAPRFGRSPDFIERVERIAQYKLSLR